jgi:hypothetical protein
VATQGGLEDRGRCRELLDRRCLRRLEIQDAENAVEAGKRRSDLRDRRLGDLAREVAPRSVVELDIERRPPEAFAEPRRTAERFFCPLWPHAVGDPLRRGHLPVGAARHHHRVDARLEARDHDVFDRDVGDPAHVEGVGHGEALEPHLVAKEVGEDRPRDRGGRFGVQGGIADVRAHHGRRSGREGASEREELAPVERLAIGGHVGSREVRIEGRVAVPWEVLRRRRDTCALRSAHPCRRELGDALRVITEGARADHRVARLDVHVADGCVVHGDPVREQPLADRAGGALCVARIAGCPDRHRAWEDRAIADAHDGPAFLIDRDRNRRKAAACSGVLRFAEHRAHLVPRPYVPAEREEEKSADLSGTDRVQDRSRHVVTVETGPDQRSGAELGHDLRRRRYRASVICPSGRPRGMRVDFSRVMRRI